VVATPSSTEREAFGPPMSVRTQPGQTALTLMPVPWSSLAKIRVSAFRPALETRYAGKRLPMSPSWPRPDDR
jgi:hypothetical protein